VLFELAGRADRHRRWCVVLPVRPEVRCRVGEDLLVAGRDM